MKRGCLVRVGIVVLILLGLMSCKEKAEVHSIQTPISPEAARLVRQVTSGLISPGAEIMVQFFHPFDEQAPDGKILAFSPNIKGKLICKDSRTLIFRPEKTLPYRKSFSARLDLDLLFPNEKDKPGVFTFAFESAGREVSSFEGDFYLEQQDNPDILVYRGKISFSEPALPADVKRSVRFHEGGKNIPLAWKNGNEATEFSFTSDKIVRGEQPRQFTFMVKQDSLELSGDFFREVPLEALTAFSLETVIPRTEGINPGFNLIFSDELDQTQNLAGLIRVEPYIEIKTSVAGKIVSVDGAFSFGGSYLIIVNKGIRSRWGTRSVKEVKNNVNFEDIKPQMEFLHNGVFLPSQGQGKIYFRTVNLRSVDLEVKKVFENNLGQFLQTERLTSRRDRKKSFRNQYISRVGIKVAEETLEIGEDKNIWLNHELDISSLLDPEEKGPLLISLSFKKEDMLYSLGREGAGYRSGDYYSNPNSRGYIYAHGRIYKPLIISDIGLTWKAAGQEHQVFVTGLIDANPLESALVELRSYQNQLLASGNSDKEGRVSFPNVDGEVFFVTAEKNNQRSVIKANEMSWSLSSFDTEGVDIGPEGTRAFLFTERGVYRPGDVIYLSAILRNQDETFPDNHPVSLKFTNPRGQVVYEEINTTGLDGFYQFKLITEENDPTGNWQAEITAGSSRFINNIRVETIVPFRLKVNLTPEKKRLDYTDKFLECRIESSYLFGAPASGLEARLELRLAHRDQHFASFPGFSFNNETVQFQEVKETSFEGTLDQNGAVDFRIKLPSFRGAPSALDLILTAGTVEKGGREVTRREILPVVSYPYYIGIQKPELQYGYMQLGSRQDLSVICVDQDGKAVTGRSLTYHLYRNNRYWWWEYDSYNDFRLRYKSDSQTKLITEGSLVSENSPVQFVIKPDSWGEYLVEVEDQDGHKSGFFFRASRWGGTAGGDNAGLLAIKADRDLYHPGDKAEISLPSAPEGSLLVTVEKGNNILSAKWHPLEKGETNITIPITKEMLPTAYVTVSFIQPYRQQSNDRPIRMYGIVALKVEDTATRQELEIITSERFRPNQDFTVTLQTGDKKPTRFTLAVVDQGLLDLTAFKTPDPWSEFYKKQRLAVSTYDLFNEVIGAHKGDVFRTFSIGGSEGLLMVDEDSDSGRRKRFVPVVFATEPAMTDKKGRARISFKMPNYMGAVRIMAVTAQGACYGHAEKSVPVSSDLVILPSLPRVLGPDEKIEIPVSLFAMDDSINTARVTLETDGPVAVVGSNRKQISFSTDKREADLFFTIRSRAAIGQARIILKAEGGGTSAVSNTDIEIRASSPPLYRSFRKTAEPGEKVTFDIPDDGIPGTNTARITISPWGNLDLSRRLGWLIRYPYGCIEQTTSAVFPQLFLKEIIRVENQDRYTIDKNINTAIVSLRRFQLASGGFSYWPGSEELSTWGTNYAGHFLIEAEKLGYPVPPDMKQRWIRFQYSRSLTYQDDLTTQIYRLYLLALAGRPAFGPMNLIVENSSASLTDTQTWILAAAYHLTGMGQTVDRLLLKAGIIVKKYSEFGGTYGSSLRDRGLMLDMSTLLNRRKTADRLYEEIADRLSSQDWYSTQTLGYCLLAVGKYLQFQRGAEPPVIAGSIKLPDNGEVPFFIQDEELAYDVQEGFGRKITIIIDKETNVRHSFLMMEWEGIPLKAEIEQQSKNLSLKVNWYDKTGKIIDPGIIAQGSEFWAHFRVGKTASYRMDLQEITLNQIFPSGWEIENFRLSGEPPPSWSRNFKLEQEEYLDIRDDRITWFFDLPSRKNQLDFIVKLRAVTVGSFTLPPTVCQTMYRNDYRAVEPGADVRVIRN